MLQPDALQMVQQRHRRGDCVMTMRTVDRTGMTVPTHAAGVAESLAAADPGHHRGRELLGHQRRTLLDVELQICADTRGVEQRPPLPDRLRVKPELDQRGFETLAVVRSRDREAGGVEQTERTAAAEVGNVEPGGLLGANAHDGDVARRLRAGLLERRQDAQSRHHPRGPVVVASLKNTVEVRADHDLRGAAIAAGQRHHQVADRIDGYLQADVIGCSAHDVVRRLLAGAVAVAHHAAATPGCPVKTIEKRRRQLKIGLKLFDRHFDRAC